jgi:protein required for attachment to host cells
MSIWILVADSSKARILTAADRTSPLTEIKDLINPEGRLREQELVTDASGSGNGSGAGTHSMGHEKDAHQHQVEIFARELCGELDIAAQGKNIQKIYLVAPPRLLGLLRAGISKPCAGKLAGEVGKNLVNHSVEDIRTHLPRVL